MLEKLRLCNEKLIQYYENDEENLKKQKLIQKILSDSQCFFRMNIQYAYAILRDLQIKEEDLKQIYLELIK